MKFISILRNNLWLFLILFFSTSNLKSQTKIDLEKLSFNTDVATLLKNYTSYSESREIPTSLPCTTTKQVGNFKFGNIVFTNGGENGPNDAPLSRISFLYKDANSKQLAGIVINVEKSSESKALGKYVNAKYGKGEVLAKLRAPRADRLIIGIPAKLFRNSKKNQTIILVDCYNLKNNKQAIWTTLFIIDNDVKAINAGIEGTVVKVLSEMYKE